MPTAPPADADPPAGPLTWGRGAVLLAAAAGLALFAAFGPDERTALARAAAWRADVRQNLVAAAVAFALAEAALVGLSVPVGVWLTVLAGYLFGVWVGAAVVLAGATAGAVVAFLGARYVFADALRRAAAGRPRVRRALDRVDAGLRARGAYYVLLLRLTPVLPFFALNLLLGLTRVRVGPYAGATLVGMAPVTLVVANAGASLADVTSFRDALSWRVIGALCLMPLVPLGLHHTAGRWLARPPAPAP